MWPAWSWTPGLERRWRRQLISLSQTKYSRDITGVRLGKPALLSGTNQEKYLFDLLVWFMWTRMRVDINVLFLTRALAFIIKSVNSLYYEIIINIEIFCMSNSFGFLFLITDVITFVGIILLPAIPYDERLLHNKIEKNIPPILNIMTDLRYINNIVFRKLQQEFPNLESTSAYPGDISRYGIFMSWSKFSLTVLIFIYFATHTVINIMISANRLCFCLSTYT